MTKKQFMKALSIAQSEEDLSQVDTSFMIGYALPGPDIYCTYRHVAREIRDQVIMMNGDWDGEALNVFEKSSKRLKVTDDTDEIRVSLRDAHTSELNGLVGHVNIYPEHVSIAIDGYEGGGCPDASPIFVESYDGEVRVIVYANGRTDDPTHVISLNGAKKR